MHVCMYVDERGNMFQGKAPMKGTGRHPESMELAFHTAFTASPHSRWVMHSSSGFGLGLRD
jgi:ribulose-5-phosphate 4-epimerase/fuculose-1-phosphate aldolase